MNPNLIMFLIVILILVIGAGAGRHLKRNMNSFLYSNQSVMQSSLSLNFFSQFVLRYPIEKWRDGGCG